MRLFSVAAAAILLLCCCCCVVVASSDVVEMGGNVPPGVVWVVQMSDIHISKWVPARGEALRRSLGPALNLIKPAVVLVTGDLTDAKNQDMTTTQQDEVEWIEYRESFQKVADDSGIPLRRFYDLRGNHDKYGVPLLHSPLDYHSKYSISAQLNRTGLLQNVTVQGGDGRKHHFVGFDDAMSVGLRGPSNIFGHPTDELLTDLDQELKRWDDGGTNVTKIVYGHFPMSFTTTTETGKRVEDVLAGNDVTAYVCGHLHTTFGRRLYRQHKERSGAFWEWEMGDWRASRMMRLLAVDQGHTSFVDIELTPPSSSPTPTIILQTCPLDSRFMLQTPPTDSIRALVFSPTPPRSVRARVFSPHLHLLSEIPMNASDESPHYYTASWEEEEPPHATQIVVESANGSLVLGELRYISPQPFHLTFMAWLVMGFRWETLFPFMVWGTILPLAFLLLFSKAFHLRRGEEEYPEWRLSVFEPSTSFRGGLWKFLQVPFWSFVECSRNTLLWGVVVTYVGVLTLFPWFSGRCLADDYPIGYLSLINGWTVQLDETVSGLGIPDIMVIVMSYLVGVMLPLLLMVSALSAERAACEFHLEVMKEEAASDEDSSTSSSMTQESDPLISKGKVKEQVKEEEHQCGLCSRKVRKGLFVGCFAVAFIHWRLCLIIGRAYGFPTLATAPAYAWSVPMLLVYSIFHTSRVRCKPGLTHQH